MQLQLRQGKKTVCAVQFFGQPVHTVKSQKREGVAPLVATDSDLQHHSYHPHLSHSELATACVTTRFLLITWPQM